MPFYRLTYFDARGMAEICRLIFAHAHVEYEDIRIPIGRLTEDRKVELGLKWGHLPVLEFDNRTFSQSLACGRYLARKYNLVGVDEFEEFKADEYIDEMREYFHKWVPLFHDTTPEDKKEELKKSLLEKENPRLMSKFNDLLLEKTTAPAWLVGEKMTWADLVLAHFIDNWNICFNVTLAKGYPAIEQLIEDVFNSPGIKEWMETRPDTRW